MTYGLQVTNVDGRTVVDSDEGYPNVKLSIGSNITSTESSPTTVSNLGSTLVFARPNTTTGGPYGVAFSKSVIYGTEIRVQEEWMTNYSGFTYPGSGSYNVATLSNQTSPATPSEYGLEIFDSLGNTTLLMTEGFNTSFDILYTGVANTSTTTFANVNWQSDSNIYVLINNTNHTFATFQGSTYEMFQGFVFESNGSLTYKQEFYVGSSFSFFADISGNDYLVVRIKS